MSSTINASTASGGGLVTSADASGILQLQTAGVTALTINASQNVGIGTSSPSKKLDILGEAQISFNSINTYLYYQSTNNYTGRNTDGNMWMNVAGGQNNIFGVAGSEKMRIDSSGNVGIGTSSPDVKLHIGAATPTQGILAHLTNTTGSTGTGAYLQFTSAGVADWAIGQPAGVTGALSFRYGTNISSAGTEYMRIDSSGNLLVGTTSNTVNNSNSFVYRPDIAAEILNHISGTVTGSQYIYFGYNGSVIGSVTQNGTAAVAYNTSSDQRLKTNIVDAPSALDSINAIKVRSFDWKSDSSHVNYGYIAQELLEVAPEAVSVPSDEDEMMGVDFGKLTPRLVKAIQELKAIIDTQNARIEALEAK